MSNPPPKNTTRSWFRYFQYEDGRDSPSEARNVLLVVVALIAAVTFQAGVNPPGGVWQLDDKEGHKAGRAIYASQIFPFCVFLVSNTLALSSSILVIISLTYRFPFHFEVWVATASMFVTYGASVFAVTPRDLVKFRLVLIAAAVPFMVRCVIQMYNKVKTKIQSRKSSSTDRSVSA